ELQTRDYREFRKALTCRLLADVAHELAFLEEKILSTDYSNWRSLAAWKTLTGEDDLRSAARGFFALRVRDMLGDFLRQGVPLTEAGYTAMVRELRALIHINVDPDSAALKAAESKDVVRSLACGKDPAALSPEAISRRMLGELDHPIDMNKVFGIEEPKTAQAPTEDQTPPSFMNNRDHELFTPPRRSPRSDRPRQAQ
ncbi:MAG: hypothetical protein V1926_05585, partial [Candidatus Peregrinibacteria bacterium]